MKTIVIQVDNSSNTNLILEAIKQFKGVKNAQLASKEQLENLSILLACKDARKTDFVEEEKITETLK